MAMTPFERRMKMTGLRHQIHLLEKEVRELECHPDGHDCTTGFGGYSCVVCGKPAAEFEYSFNNEDDGN